MVIVVPVVAAVVGVILATPGAGSCDTFTHPVEVYAINAARVVSKYRSPIVGDAGLFPVVPLPVCPFAAVLCVDIADDKDVDVARAEVSEIPCTVVVEELCAEIAAVTSESVAADVFALNKFAISLILDIIHQLEI